MSIGALRALSPGETYSPSFLEERKRVIHREMVGLEARAVANRAALNQDLQNRVARLLNEWRSNGYPAPTGAWAAASTSALFVSFTNDFNRLEREVDAAIEAARMSPSSPPAESAPLAPTLPPIAPTPSGAADADGAIFRMFSQFQPAQAEALQLFRTLEDPTPTNGGPPSASTPNGRAPMIPAEQTPTLPGGATLPDLLSTTRPQGVASQLTWPYIVGGVVLLAAVGAGLWYWSR